MFLNNDVIPLVISYCDYSTIKNFLRTNKLYRYTKDDRLLIAIEDVMMEDGKRLLENFSGMYFSSKKISGRLKFSKNISCELIYTNLLELKISNLNKADSNLYKLVRQKISMGSVSIIEDLINNMIYTWTWNLSGYFTVLNFPEAEMSITM